MFARRVEVVVNRILHARWHGMEQVEPICALAAGPTMMVFLK
jgi:hypothetical protein